MGADWNIFPFVPIVPPRPRDVSQDPHMEAMVRATDAYLRVGQSAECLQRVRWVESGWSDAPTIDQPDGEVFNAFDSMPVSDLINPNDSDNSGDGDSDETSSVASLGQQ